MMNWFVSEESGQGMVEYGLIIALIAVVLIGALTALGGGLNNVFGQITAKLGGASGAGGASGGANG